jgi:BASS family bile acid:Na+ symporter
VKQLLTFLKNWTLPTAIIVGTAGFPVFGRFDFLLPYLIFAMLLLTFCRIPLSNIRLNLLHCLLFGFQIGGSLLAYVLLAPFNILLAEGAMVCIISPPGTASAVITQKLGEDAASITSFSILSNLGTAIAVPLLFPLLHPLEEGYMGFWPAFFTILQKVGPILILPFILAALLRRFTPKLNQRLCDVQEVAFYLWSSALVIVVAKTVNAVVHDPAVGTTTIWLGLTATCVCAIQFFAGKQIGTCFGERITGGQALGQKNSVLAVWIAQNYLTPVTAVAACAHLICQNLFNAWQLATTRRRQEPL